MNIIRKTCLFALFFYCCALSAQTASRICDSMKIHFRQGKTDLVPSFSDNEASLEKISDKLRVSRADSVYRLQRILIVGGASPEGSVSLNRWLSEKRAGALLDYLSRYGELPDSMKTVKFIGRDWDGLLLLAENDPKLPYRTETLELLHAISRNAHGGVLSDGDPLQRLQQLHGGGPWSYMYARLFPELRALNLYLWYEKVVNPEALPKSPLETYSIPFPAPTIDTLRLLYDSAIPQARPAKPFYMALKTNMLYDLLAVPNIGAEFHLGRNWSVAANWMYGWWDTDRKHRYWRIYGGDIAVRKWFGRRSREKPLTGHHAGLFGQILTYDFEWGGRGYMGGKPGGTLWDKMHWGAGIEYGYSVPVARRLNIDFTLGVGYLGGEYYEYLPIDGCYVWQATKQRHWFGPTKAEISLVWLIGHKNRNGKKGGHR